ncbi:hypothetical protein BLNAU_10646 [Blattamonas nauphoetae]|uniref:Uncharacterized protein n=1 Tax=Blattamonas nauphoetae TaxID=2049346 RepID=A0ABQ9XRI2_9EUKA|nr:hypothetical protein BLNAU_10646 [Blattamonas nauphoetae]
MSTRLRQNPRNMTHSLHVSTMNKAAFYHCYNLDRLDKLRMLTNLPHFGAGHPPARLYSEHRIDTLSEMKGSLTRSLQRTLHISPPHPKETFQEANERLQWFEEMERWKVEGRDAKVAETLVLSILKLEKFVDLQSLFPVELLDGSGIHQLNRTEGTIRLAQPPTANTKPHPYLHNLVFHVHLFMLPAADVVLAMDAKGSAGHNSGSFRNLPSDRMCTHSATSDENVSRLSSPLQLTATFSDLDANGPFAPAFRPKLQHFMLITYSRLNSQTQTENKSSEGIVETERECSIDWIKDHSHSILVDGIVCLGCTSRTVPSSSSVSLIADSNRPDAKTAMTQFSSCVGMNVVRSHLILKQRSKEMFEMKITLVDDDLGASESDHGDMNESGATAEHAFVILVSFVFTRIKRNKGNIRLPQPSPIKQPAAPTEGSPLPPSILDLPRPSHSNITPTDTHIFKEEESLQHEGSTEIERSGREAGRSDQPSRADWRVDLPIVGDVSERDRARCAVHVGGREKAEVGEEEKDHGTDITVDADGEQKTRGSSRFERRRRQPVSRSGEETA